MNDIRELYLIATMVRTCCTTLEAQSMVAILSSTCSRPWPVPICSGIPTKESPSQWSPRTLQTPSDWWPRETAVVTSRQNTNYKIYWQSSFELHRQWDETSSSSYWTDQILRNSLPQRRVCSFYRMMKIDDLWFFIFTPCAFVSLHSKNW